jgi:hypothetical protein
MRMYRVLALCVAGFLAAPAVLAQAPVTAADVTRLEASASEIGRQVEVLKKSDPTLATDVGRVLTELTDDVTYLRVKMRREGTVTREEYASIRDRLETLRVRAQGQKVAAQPVMDDRGGAVAIPVGTEFDLKHSEGRATVRGNDSA